MCNAGWVPHYRNRRCCAWYAVIAAVSAAALAAVAVDIRGRIALLA